MADKYTKTLEILTKFDKTQYDAAMTTFKKDSKALQFLNEKAAKKLTEGYARAEANMKKIKLLKQSIEEIKMFGGKDSKQTLKELQTELKKLEKLGSIEKFKLSMNEIGKSVGKKVAKAFEDAGKAIVKLFTDTFKDAIKELKTMASYNFGTTLFQNRKGLQTSLQYGLSGGQSYALNKALDFFGASSIEDTYYWNENQRNAFAEKIGKYVDKYNSLNDSGFFEKWDRFQYDFKTFKEDMMYDIMEWIMDNKDVIYTGFQVLTNLMKIVVNILGKIGEFLHIERTQSQIDAKTADIIGNYSTTNTRNNLTVNNTFNGVQTSNRQELVNAGELTMTQMKKVLYGY